MFFLNFKSWFCWLWSSTDFEDDEMTRYAEQFMVAEVSQGVGILGTVTLLLLLSAASLFGLLDYSDDYLYTCAVLSLLCLHIIFSSRKVADAKALFLLCITLIIVSGAAFVLLAHREGNLSNALLPTVVVLYMIIPIVPWGLREAVAAMSLVYLMFTLSTVSVTGRFSLDDLLVLQFMMLAAAMVSLVILGRNVSLRKDDIKARYELEKMNRKMEKLSYEDGLTGAWNRRYFEVQFKRVARRMLERSTSKVFFGLLDIDEFKQINDVHGHLAGDDVLKKITGVLQEVLGESSYVFRIGGDEFVILFEASSHMTPLQVVADKLHQQSIVGCGVNVSMGVIEIQDSHTDTSLEALYKEADKSLYAAKTRKFANKNSLNCEISTLQVETAI